MLACSCEAADSPILSLGGPLVTHLPGVFLIDYMHVLGSAHEGGCIKTESAA